VRGIVYKSAELNDFHPTRAAIIEAEGAPLGVMGQISPQAAERCDVPERTYVFELDFNRLMEISGRAGSYQPLSRYPAVTRDLAVVVADDVPYRRVDELISSEGGELLESLKFFDLYTGAPLPAGQKNLAFSVIFRSRERTLRDEEVDDLLNRIKQSLATQLGATFRET
jgi:phenylalanyl-tRNA synthetase beta chain